MKEKNIGVIMQALYGNRTYIELSESQIDYMLQGIMDNSIMHLSYAPDRTVVKIPGSKCVLVYNKYQEEKELEDNKKALIEAGDVAKPLAFIPEDNVEIYSRCFVCRMTEDEKFESIEREDKQVIFKYLAY